MANMNYKEIILALLGEAKTKSHDNHEWQYCCPLHGETNPSFSINIDTGLWICYACGKKGNIKQLAEQLATLNLKIIPNSMKAEDVKIRVMLDERKYTQKPTSVDISKIVESIEDLEIKEYTLINFIEEISMGKTVIPAGVRSVEALANRELELCMCMIDIDNSHKENGVDIINEKICTKEQVIDYTLRIGLPPTFIYPTFNDGKIIDGKKVPKFRLVYILRNPITKKIVAEMFTKKLMNSLKDFNIDKSCQNISRIFAGTNKSCELIKNREGEVIVYDVEEMDGISDIFRQIDTHKTYNQVAEEIIAENHFKQNFNIKYIFNGMIYEPLEQEKNYPFINKLTIKKVDAKATISYKKEVASRIFDTLECEEEQITANIITFANGQINIENTNKKLEKYSAEVFAINILPINYNPNVVPIKAMDDFLNNFTCNNFERKKCLLLYIAFAMIPSIIMPKALILYGASGENGKSILLNIIVQLLGRENTKHIPLDKLEKHQFLGIEVLDKLLVFDADTKEYVPEDLQQFREIITGDIKDVEGKFQKCRDGKPYATYIYALNKIPKSFINEHRHSRRIQVLPCEFIPTQEHKQVFDLNKIVTSQSLEYLAKLAMDELWDWISKGGTDGVLPNLAESDRIITEQLEKTNEDNIINDFIYDLSITEQISKKMKATDLYNLFQLYCSKNKLGFKEWGTSKSFYERIRKTGKFIETKPNNLLTFEFKG